MRGQGDGGHAVPGPVESGTRTGERVIEMSPSMPKRRAAEFLGTFVLVFVGCGTAVMATTDASLCVGWLGVAPPSD